MQQFEEHDLLPDEVIKLMLAELTWHTKRIQRKLETLPAGDERHALLSVMFTQWWCRLDLQSGSDRP